MGKINWFKLVQILKTVTGWNKLMQPSRDASEISYSHTFYSIFFPSHMLAIFVLHELVLFYLIINLKFFFTTTQILHTKILFQCTHIYNFFRVGNSVSDFLVILAYNVIVIFGGKCTYSYFKDII